MVISLIWLYSGLWAVFPLFGWGGYGPEPFGVACSVDWASYQDSLNHSTFIMSLSIFCTFIPCLVILFSYSGIAWKLHKAYQSIQNGNFNYGHIERKVTLVSMQGLSVDCLLTIYRCFFRAGISICFCFVDKMEERSVRQRGNKKWKNIC
jgi:hypothetical protein